MFVLEKEKVDLSLEVNQSLRWDFQKTKEIIEEEIVASHKSQIEELNQNIEKIWK